MCVCLRVCKLYECLYVFMSKAAFKCALEVDVFLQMEGVCLFCNIYIYIASRSTDRITGPTRSIRKNDETLKLDYRPLSIYTHVVRLAFALPHKSRPKWGGSCRLVGVFDGELDQRIPAEMAVVIIEKKSRVRVRI